MEVNGMKLPDQGLSQEEVEQRKQRGQTNAQPRAQGKSAPQILFSNLFTLFNLLNFALAVALLAVGSYRNLLFMGVVLSNTIIGTVQELRAKRTMDRLELMSTPSAHVIRGGEAISIPPDEVVLDDLLVVRAGDQLCVDAQVVFGVGAADESLLTGESVPVDKGNGDALLSGSFIAEGTLYARATKVGAESYAAELAKRAKVIKQPSSGLMQSMRHIIRIVSAALVPLGIILFIKQYFFMADALQSAVTSTVAAMLGMIPEGLILLTSVALAVGVVRLGQKNALVQELYGIETLARVDTLCVDKTGTITKGSMAVTAVEPLNGMRADEIEENLNALVGALADDNATFRALRERFTEKSSWRPIHTVPFSSARKWSAASFDRQGTCVIGAAEFILKDGIDGGLRKKIDEHAMQGNRVLLLCRSAGPMIEKQLPEDLQPCALVVLSDVLRDDAKEILTFFAEEQVQVKVISGDNPLTVARVAQQAGVLGAEKAVDATTLDTPKKLKAAAEQYTVFGRVTPEQKKDLILALKDAGRTVGMLGDGVNDIPALKASDCSIAMAGSSDATRRVAQISLLDGNFAAVPDIVMEGRRVINNITRASSLFLVKTIFSFLLSLLLVFLPMAYPFAPIQMTLISGLTVGFPSFVLALEPNRARVKGKFLYNVLRNALPGGLTVVLLILANFILCPMLGIPETLQSTIATWTTGCTGLLVLFFTCRPLNAGRIALVASMAIAFFAIALGFGPIFYLLPLTAIARNLTLALCAVSLPLLLSLRKAVRLIMR